MTKKIALALGCLALLTSFAGTAMADAITFSFVFGPPVTIDATGLNAGPALVLLVSDTKVPTFFSLVGTASISTGAAAPTTYQATSTTLNAQFLPGRELKCWCHLQLVLAERCLELAWRAV